MKSELFQPTVLGEMRILILINAFSHNSQVMEGRTKIAKLDFFLRYPLYFQRALEIRKPDLSIRVPLEAEDTIEARMVRYRYGPWDPAYFSLIGRLIGKGLVEPVSLPRGIGFRTTSTGVLLVNRLAELETWEPIVDSAELLRRHLNLSGAGLVKFVYDYFPEVTMAKWGDEL